MKEKEKKIKNSEDKTTAQASPEKYIKELRRQRRQNIFFAISTFIAICALGLAWFVSNTRVSGTGIQISAQGSRFSLASTGTTGRYDIDSNTFVTGKEITTEEGDKYYLTEGKIITWMSDSVNNLKDNEIKDANDKEKVTINDLLRPGASGQITFYIWPFVNDLTSIDIDLTLIPYVDVDTESDVEGSIFTKIYTMGTSGVASSSKQKIAPIKTNYEANSLIKGHFLFFQNYSENKYSNWVQNRNITVKPKDGTTFTKDKPQKVTLYWIWPMQFDSYVTKNENAIQLFAGKDEWDLFKQDFIKEPQKYLDEQSRPENIGTIYQGMDSSNRAITPYRASYNAGDQLIGEQIRFVMLQVMATEG